jgi:hypothetical protein
LPNGYEGNSAIVPSKSPIQSNWIPLAEENKGLIVVKVEYWQSNVGIYRDVVNEITWHPVPSLFFWCRKVNTNSIGLLISVWRSSLWLCMVLHSQI